MLMQNVMHREDHEDGSFTIWPSDEWEELPCVECGGESVHNQCPGDGSYHHHGLVHDTERGLVAICDDPVCLDVIKIGYAMKRAAIND